MFNFRKFLPGAVLAAALLASPVVPFLGAAPAQALETKSVTRTLTLLASAARTATATGSWISTAISTQPVSAITIGLSRHMHVFLNVSAASSGTLDLTIEGSVDGGTTAFTLTAASAWTQVTTSTSKQVRRYEGPIPPLVRAVGTGASTPVHTYSVHALAGG
jgi:hypothetical protein